MEFYWDTSEIRAYDFVYSSLSSEDRETIETFYHKLGRYWKDSLSRWTTTPNLVEWVSIELLGHAVIAWADEHVGCVADVRHGELSPIGRPARFARVTWGDNLSWNRGPAQADINMKVFVFLLRGIGNA
jgi:hypothetical protein